MENDLINTPWIVNKVRSSASYAQNLYAAMCNHDFMKNDVVPILKEETWSCSWRHSGRIVSVMKGSGDYMDWYCSGTYAPSEGNPNELGYVNECTVTDEIRKDLFTLGWLILPD